MDHPQTLTLKNKAYNIIKRKIVTCELAPGMPVSEKELMEEIGVSRTPVREALSRLENENLVQVFPKRGIFVTNITQKEIVDIYTMRMCVESCAVRLAVPNLDDAADIDYFYDIFAAKKYNPSFEEHLAIDRQLHMRIAQRSGNKYVEQTVAEMYDLGSRIRYQHISTDFGERLEQSRKEHVELLAGLRKRDSEAASHAMRKHISIGMHGALRLLDGRQVNLGFV